MHCAQPFPTAKNNFLIPIGSLANSTRCGSEQIFYRLMSLSLNISFSICTTLYPPSRKISHCPIKWLIKFRKCWRWQGDTFIEGDDLSIYPEFENWRQNRQWKLGYFRRFLLKRLADHYNLSGKLEESLDLYLQLASLDLLSTELHLTILDLLLRLGQHQDFVEYCDMLEAVYERSSIPLCGSHSCKMQVFPDPGHPN